MSKQLSYAADVATLDAILQAVYDVISGPAGQPRDWDRFRNLFVQGARLMPIVGAAGEKADIRVLSPDEYIQRVKSIFTGENFWERETSRQTELYGHAAHVLSAYESLRNLDQPPFERGTNSIQLFHDGVRWWIVSVMWNTSRAE